MDKIVRLRECDVCGIPVIEDYVGSPTTMQEKMFKNKLHTIVFIPPEGKSTSWHVCPQCASGVEDALKSVTAHRKTFFDKTLDDFDKAFDHVMNKAGA